MRISAAGAMVVALGAVVGIVIWIVGYFGLPNRTTHRILSENPPIATSASEKPSSTTPPTPGSGGSPGGTNTPAANAGWYSLGKQPKTLDLIITAAATTDQQGLNFNGYSAGQLKITVPVGWKVDVTFKNHDASVPHSVAFVPYADRMAMGAPKLAFRGAASPNPTQGITAAGGSQRFSFVANKAGKYAFMCAVPGHAMNGMWDEFDVSASAKTPSITTGSSTVQVTK